MSDKRFTPPGRHRDGMSDLAWTKVHNLFLAQRDLRAGRTALSATPRVILLEVTNRCNLECRTCARNYWDAGINPEGDIDLETVQRLAPFLERASEVWLSGYGESLVARGFFDILSYLGGLECKTGLNSNGSTLTPRVIDRLIVRGLDYLTISLDGATEAMISSTRSGISLKGLLRKLAVLTRKKESLGVDKPEVMFRFTATLRNIRELPDLVRLAYSHGVARITVTVARIFDDSQIEECLLHDVAGASAVFGESRAVAEGCGVRLLVPDFEHRGCTQPFNTLFVKWDGNVAACCASAFNTRPPLQIQLGNLRDTTLDGMWNGDRVRTVRAGLLGNVELDPICARCAYHELSLANLIKTGAKPAG